MYKIKKYDIRGVETGEVEFEGSALPAGRGDQAVHDVVVGMMAGRRAGTASTLRKGEVAGSNRKLWRQKGTGRARTGLKQSPVWRGGGVAFGPHPRSYGKKTNKKVARLAFRRAFEARLDSGDVKIIESLDFALPRTKELAGILAALKLSGGVLFVVGRPNKNLLLSARNIPGAGVVSADALNAYDILRYNVLVMDSDAIAEISRRLAG